MIFLNIFIFLVELGIISYLVYQFIKNKNFLIKTTLAYPILVLVSFITIFTIKNVYENTDWYVSLAGAFSGAFNVLTFTISEELIALLKTKEAWFTLVDYIGLVICSAVVSFSVAGVLFKAVVVNFFRNTIGEKEVTYIFGLTNDAKTFLENQIPQDVVLDEKTKELNKKHRKQTVVVLPYDNTYAYEEEKTYLDSKKVKYVIARYKKHDECIKSLKSLIRSKKKKYYILSFIENDKELYDFITRTKEFMLSYHKMFKVEFIVSANEVQKSYIQTYITSKDFKENRPLLGKIRVFNKEDLTAYDFICHHNLASYMPKEYINEDCTIDSLVDVHFFVIGFGKTNQAMLRDNLVNTQFVQKKNNQLVKTPVYTHIYDVNKEVGYQELAFGLFKYKKEQYTSEDYFGLPEDYVSKVKFNFGANIYSSSFMNDIYNIIKASKKSVNYFFIAFGTDLENASLANELNNAFNNIDGCYNIFFAKMKETMEVSGVQTNIVPFGNKNLLSYDNVIMDKIYDSARCRNFHYWQEKLMKQKAKGEDVEVPEFTRENVLKWWYGLSRIRQLSNLYSIANLKFKLSLLGMENELELASFSSKILDHPYSQERYINLTKEATDYFASDVLAVLEHERWNAFELSLGVLPYKKSLTIEKKSSKTENEMYHANIATIQGLVDYLNTTGEDVISYDYDDIKNVLVDLEKHLLDGLDIKVAKK